MGQGPQHGFRVAGSDAPELAEVRLGYLPLTDCASLILAQQLGLDRRYGIRLQLTREVSWATLRDKLLGGAVHAAHLLYGLAYGIQLGIGGPRREMSVLMTLNQNGQGITLSNVLRAAGITDGTRLAQQVRRHPERLRLAHTFPTGTHALWLFYWLAAHGVDPQTEVETLTVPPPRMLERLAANALDGYSAGEPWNAHAVQTGMGFTVITSQAIWPDHPDKVLATTREFTTRYPRTARALIMTLLDAARYIETTADLNTVARRLARPEVIDTNVDTIFERLRGEYRDGLGHHWQDPHPLRFFGDGAVPFPYLSDALWFVAQQRRWGLLDHDPDYVNLVTQVNQTGLYAEAASALGVAVPSSAYRSSRLIDGRIWDGRAPELFAARSPTGNRHERPVALA